MTKRNLTFAIVVSSITSVLFFVAALSTTYVLGCGIMTAVSVGAFAAFVKEYYNG